jgi:cation diffusion facilitator family transporter
MPTGLKPGAASRKVLYVAIAGDIAVAVAKFVVAALTGSSAMMTEGVHSLVDTGNELLLLYGLKRSQHAVDEWHPFGYGKTTYILSLVVALSVFSIGGGAAVYEGIITLLDPPALADPTWSYVVLGAAAVFQWLSWRVTRQEMDRHRRAGESLWRVVHRNMDVLVYTVFVEDSAALIGIAIAALGVWASHTLDNPYLDPAASVVIGLVLIASAALLANKSIRLLVGESIDSVQLAQVRTIIAADPAVESVGRLLTMRLGPDSILLTAAVRFQRKLNLDEVEKAIERLEFAIRISFPAIHHLYLESGALKQVPRAARRIIVPEASKAVACN